MTVSVHSMMEILTKTNTYVTVVSNKNGGMYEQHAF
jgi:hypothetical protein